MITVAVLTIHAKGHHNIRATHKSTWELTTDLHLTPKGDCIIGVGADYSVASLPEWLKNHLQHGGQIDYTLLVGGHSITGTAFGHPNLTFENTTEMVIRTSEYICGRTLAINSSIAARDLPEVMQELLTSSDAILQFIIATVEDLS